ncbi:hypothetical protein PoB_006244400 [Plakobranchus ocellatus]|uniref:Uncharacterized protein n=1 Tax=Plakobranchus ocellatus TaxID=259542 RepID=A0AAV4CVM9_9GAST|nr:hypothetical protein PoB_006244400 [Plakobranchus ocellatus]
MIALFSKPVQNKVISGLQALLRAMMPVVWREPATKESLQISGGLANHWATNSPHYNRKGAFLHGREGQREQKSGILTTSIKQGRRFRREECVDSFGVLSSFDEVCPTSALAGQADLSVVAPTEIRECSANGGGEQQRRFCV